MPLYEYRCADCGHELEVLQKISDPAPVDCPSCQHPALQKKLSAAGFQLKGTGWYVTDFRGGGGTSAPAATARTGDAAGEPAKSAPGAAGDSAAATAPAASAGATPAASTPATAPSAPSSAG